MAKINKSVLYLPRYSGAARGRVRTADFQGVEPDEYISAIAVALALSAGSTFAAGSASAADLPSMKAPVYVPPPPPPPMWTGFYAGLNAGYGYGSTSNANTISLPLFDGVAAQANALDPLRQIAGTGLISGNTALANSGVANVNQGGFIGGGQIGYNYQWSPRIVSASKPISRARRSAAAAVTPARRRTAFPGKTLTFPACRLA